MGKARPRAARGASAAGTPAVALHPGAVLADILECAGIGLRAAARGLGVSPPALSGILHGTSAVSPGMALRLGMYLQGDPQAARLWLDMQRDHDLFHAGRAMAAKLKRIKPAPRAPNEQAA